MKIADHIQYAEQIAPGSKVYKAVLADGAVSAIEVLPTPLSFQQTQVFEKRVKIIKELNFHYKASVPRVLSWGLTKTGGLPFLEMEWIEGPTLTQILKEKIVLNIEEVSRVADEVSRVMALSHKLNLIHGNITTDAVIWDIKNQRYVVSGFLSPFHPAMPIHKQNIIVMPAVRSAATEVSDVKSIGLLLLKLLTGSDHLIPIEEISIERQKRLPTISTNENTVPYWLMVGIDKALGRDEHSFENGIQLYMYFLTNYKRPPETNRFYRSQPQPYFDSVEKPPLKVEKESVKNLRFKLPAIVKRKEELHFIFDRNIAAGLLIAVLLLGFSIYSQNRENKTQRENHLAGINSQPTYILDSNISAAKTADTLAVPASQNNITTRKKHKKTIAAKTQKPVFTSSDSVNTQVPISKNASRGLGIFKVRSIAYFHNAPDESTRRNAFINHWNNAHLHPLKEENGFVYIVYTNDEGQTSKGWLKLSDLIRQ